jgi:protocatechuate 3,4-dioxygenase beta subunit
MNLRGRFTTDAEGRFRLRSVKPAGRRVAPGAGAPPLLPRAHPLLIHKPGCKTLVTQVFVDEDEHLESDVVFGVTRALVGGYRRHDGVAAPDGSRDGPWYSLRYGFTMEPGKARLPRPPIA